MEKQVIIPLEEYNNLLKIADMKTNNKHIVCFGLIDGDNIKFLHRMEGLEHNGNIEYSKYTQISEDDVEIQKIVNRINYYLKKDKI